MADHINKNELIRRMKILVDAVIPALADHTKTRQEMEDLVFPQGHPARAAVRWKPESEIYVSYMSFITWMALNDFNRRHDLTTDLNSFRRDKAKYQSRRARPRDPAISVLDQLGDIFIRRTGKVLLTSITKKKVIIEPNVEGVEATGVKEPDPVKVNISGFPIYDFDGKSSGEIGKGGGADVLLEYSPEMFGPHGTGGLRGPGTNPDEALFHELIHAHRDTEGISMSLAVSGKYFNLEEFVAVVITNIYLSEKKQSRLRDNEKDFSILQQPDKFLDNVQHISPEPRALLDVFRWKQPQYFWRMAQIDPSIAAFNPIRQLYLEKTRIVDWAVDAIQTTFGPLSRVKDLIP